MDKQKISAYLDHVEATYLGSASDFDRGIIYQVRRMKEAMHRGEFNSDPIPLPIIKPEDKPKQSCPYCGATTIHYCPGRVVSHD